jgi:hypothetical protein
MPGNGWDPNAACAGLRSSRNGSRVTTVSAALANSISVKDALDMALPGDTDAKSDDLPIAERHVTAVTIKSATVMIQIVISIRLTFIWRN